MIDFKQIDKEYRVGEQVVHALHHVDFSIEERKLTIILGPSGSGKSTLLNILGGMDRPTRGSFDFNGKRIERLDNRELTQYRREMVGFVFQFYNLIASLNAVENVAIAAQLNHNADQAQAYLESVGLGKRLHNFPSQMSGGEMQRVSIARALAKKPRLLLADEPTGALDSKTSFDVIKILQDVAESSDTAVVMVTHNADFERYGDRIIRLKDGEIESVIDNDSPERAR